MEPDYARLEAAVRTWREDFIQITRDRFGDETANSAEAELAANPWRALQWYVEDNLPAEQKVA